MEILQKKTPNFVNINFTKDSLNFDKIDAHSIDDNFMKKNTLNLDKINWHSAYVAFT